MATVRPCPSQPAPGRRRTLAPLGLLAVVIAEVLFPRAGATAGGPAAHLVPAIMAAYGEVGTLAVVLAHQLPDDGRRAAGAGAHSHRPAGGVAANGAADRPFPTASMVKLFMAEDLLHRDRVGDIRLDPTDFALMQDMIRRSNDRAASTLWVRYGGGQMVTDVAARYGLTGTTPPAVAGQWGQTTTTARDLALFLARLPVVAHRFDAAALQVWMRTATSIAADGFDQRFGVLAAAPPFTAVKQGWMCCVGGNRHLHSVGIVGHRIVVLLSEVPRTVGYDAARAALTAAADALRRPANR
jgi:hypothetical protein